MMNFFLFFFFFKLACSCIDLPVLCCSLALFAELLCTQNSAFPCLHYAATDLPAYQASPFSQQSDISFKAKLRLRVMVRWQESAICYNTAHNPAASVKSSHPASGHTHSNTSTHSRQTGSWSKHSGGRGRGAEIWLLQAFYSPVPTRQCPPTDDQVSERAASRTVACQAQRERDLLPWPDCLGLGSLWRSAWAQSEE